MARYLKVLGILLCVLGLAGSIASGLAAANDEAYFKAAKAMERYPTNVLYVTEFRMAEPRHMLLIAGAAAAAPIGLVLGSICLGIGALLGRPER